MVSDTSVPSPLVLRITAEPPRRAIRPRIDSVTPLRSGGTESGSNPRPRSRTNSDTSSGSTSANTKTTSAPDHFTAFTVASRPAASSARRSSSSSQSPTVTASTATPCWASTSCSISRTPSANVMPSWSSSPGARPSNSQVRSSRSCARASWMTCCGSLARRWIRASVCSTESCTRAAMSALLGPGPGLALHHQVPRDPQPPGPSTSTIAASSSTAPLTGATCALALRPATQQPEPDAQQDHGDRQPEQSATRRPSVTGQRFGQPPDRGLLFRVALRTTSTMPTTVMVSAQAMPPIQLMPAADAKISRTISREPIPAASAMLRLSARALLTIAWSWPASGISSQAIT